MKRLYRSVNNRMFMGVCGGLGEYFDIDPTMVRLGVVFLAFFTAGLPVSIAYIIAGVVIPERPDYW